MNSNDERIKILESMLNEEREKVTNVLGYLESYAMGLDMMAQIAYAETPFGSREDKNTRAVKQHTADLVAFLAVKVDELRGLMGRSLPAVPVEMTGEQATAMFNELMAYLPEPEAMEAVPDAPPTPTLPGDTERPAGVTIH